MHSLIVAVIMVTTMFFAGEANAQRRDRPWQSDNATGNQNATEGSAIGGRDVNVGSGNTNTNSGNTNSNTNSGNTTGDTTHGNNSPIIKGGRDVIIHGLPQR
jgi:hypothetical protein